MLGEFQFADFPTVFLCSAFDPGTGSDIDIFNFRKQRGGFGKNSMFESQTFAVATPSFILYKVLIWISVCGPASGTRLRSLKRKL